MCVFAVIQRLTLGELACFSCFLETVFLTFFHSRVTGQKTCALQQFSVVSVYVEQCAADAMTDSTCLACTSAAFNVSNNVICGGCACQFKWLFNDQSRVARSK